VRLAWALLLALAACGGAKPAPAPSFADLEACIAALEVIAATPVEKRANADLTACGGGRIDTGRDALVRAAEWLARRWNDAVKAGRKDLKAEVDRVVSAVMPVALSPSGEGYVLPVSRAGGQPVPPLCNYTAVKADSLRRESCGMAQLQPHRTPPLARLEGARSTVIAYPILLVADADLPAARVLEVAMEHEDGAVLLAVQGQGGAVFQHPVELRGGKIPGAAAGLDLGAADDTAAIERSLDKVRGKAEVLSLGVADGATVQRLVDLMDAAGRAGIKVVTSSSPRRPAGAAATTAVGAVVRIGQASGTIPYEPVIAMRYVRRHMRAIQSCLAPPKKPATLGSFDAEIAIDAKGKVTSASIGRLSDQRARSCALAVLERITFVEAASGGTIRFSLIVEKAR
jgi:hypothetical protein